MSARPTISQLPDLIRTNVERRLRAAAYGNLRRISEWLTDQGYPIGKSSVGRYAIRLRHFDMKKRSQKAGLLRSRPAQLRKMLAELPAVLLLDKAQTFNEIEALQIRMAELFDHLKTLS